MELRTQIGQRQVISQRFQQSLALLSLNNLELEGAIEAELEANPALERESAGDDDPAGARAEAEGEDFDWQGYLENAEVDGAVPAGEGAERDREYRDPFATLSRPEEPLAEHLRRQLEVSYADDPRLPLALELVAALDDEGYLRTPLAELAAEVGAAPAALEDALTDVVQRLEPPGVGARDLAECLLLQWQAAGDAAPPLAGVIIRNHLPDIGARTPAELARLLRVAPPELDRALDFIRSLEPFPGRAYGADVNPSLTPDFVVDWADGGVKITPLEEPAGRLHVSPRYRQLLAAGAADADARRYVRGRVAAAAWYIRALHQRRRTMEKVVAAIFGRQRDFLTEGEAGLKPLTMEDVAAAVGVHVSTVSRAVSHKAVDTPQGIYPLKRFFSGAAKAAGADVSVEQVKSALQDLIAAEDKSAALSDEDLGAALAARGFRVARRTVAKYRKELKIPGKHERTQRI